LGEGSPLWTEDFKIVLSRDPGYGYSYFKMLNDSALSKVYKGVNDLYFLKIPVRDFFVD
jgi:hypothetical protein